MARKKVNTTKLEIIQVAAKNFLEKGFTDTSAKSICEELGISPGNLTFWFHTKEHILLEFTKEITSFHDKCIDKIRKDECSDLYTYCWEVTAQITLCEDNPNIKDVYLAIYSHQMTLDYVKNWTAEKNLKILGERLSDWDLQRFRRAETVTCCIERSALTEPCSDEYTLEDKIKLTLTCLLKIYDIEKSEREKVIDEILKSDYKKTGHSLLKQLAKYVEKTNQEMIDSALNEVVIL